MLHRFGSWLRDGLNAPGTRKFSLLLATSIYVVIVLAIMVTNCIKTDDLREVHKKLDTIEQKVTK